MMSTHNSESKEMTFPYRNVTIWYMSGTGNSYRCAKWAGEFVEKGGAAPRLLQVGERAPKKETDSPKDNLLGIFMPTHGFTAPWHMIKFICRLPRSESTAAFCVATRAGLKFGPVYTPGISGSGTFIIALILAFKGYRLRGLLSLDMPSNWLSFHPGLRPQNAEAIVNRAEPKLKRFMETISSGTRSIITLNNFYEIMWAVLLSWISGLYLIIGRFFLAKLFFANKDCDGCGICKVNCPIGALRMWGKKKPRPFWTYHCESCMRCMAFCKRKAIEAGHSWAIMLYYITSIPIAVYLLSWITRSFPASSWLDNPVVQNLLYLIYFYPSVFISYYVFYLLIRIPVVNDFFTYTTLTHIYRRYHEPGTDANDLKSKKS
ncbi:EFR1 family ferrodoxin [Thermodesulfobacteriota bacterium]